MDYIFSVCESTLRQADYPVYVADKSTLWHRYNDFLERYVQDC